MSNLGEQIRALRKAQHLTLDQLSEASGVNRATICAYERQKYIPRMQTAALILDALGYTFNISKKETEAMA